MIAMNRHDALLGRDGPAEDGPTEKVTCEAALREAGVNEALIAKKLKDLLEAKHPRWNPKKKAFDMFDDYDTQLAAAREAVKIFGAYPSPGEDNQVPLIIDLGALSPKRRE